MKTVPTKCGIYDSHYTLIRHRDGRVSVKAPYVKWYKGVGSLAFRIVPIFAHSGILLDIFNGAEPSLSVHEIVSVNFYGVNFY
jgi:hypothetical protein